MLGLIFCTLYEGEITPSMFALICDYALNVENAVLIDKVRWSKANKPVDVISLEIVEIYLTLQ